MHTARRLPASDPGALPHRPLRGLGPAPGSVRFPGLAVLALFALAPWLACAGPAGPLDIGGGGSGSQPCPPQKAPCGGACVDLSSDPAHCGACGTACGDGQACAAGACAVACSGGTTRCGDACADTRDDPANCGSCGNACPAGQVCAGGACAVECLGGTTLCGAKCVDPAVDPANCGGCGNACPTGQGCSGGTCSLQCPTGLTACNGSCADTSTDPVNCGGCNMPCASGETCAGGSCHAPVLRASCHAILQAGESTGDGTYTVQPDPARPPLAVYCDMTTSGGGWTRCLNLANTAAEDLTNDTWLDQCIDWSMSAWSNGDLLLRLRDDTSAVLYATTGTRTGAWTHAQVTSNAPPQMQYDVGEHQNLVTLANGDRLMISGDGASGSGCWASMGNGYVIAVYPPAPRQFHNVRMMVQPYREQIGSSMPRNYWQGNTGWVPANEVTFVAGGFDTCGPPQAGTLGTFELYVR